MKNFLRLSVLAMMLALLAGCSKDEPEKGDGGEGGDNGGNTPGPVYEEAQVNSDLWTATDPLGRKLPDYEQTGTKKKNKYIAMFYWTWHNPNMVSYGTVGNISQILKENPNAIKEKDNPVWDRGGSNTHFWGEPLFGYYRTTDPYVLRKHAEMLADAGVDVVFFDCTNAPHLWDESYNALMKTWDQARKDGVKVPKISFLLPFGPSDASYEMIKRLYNDVYKVRKYQNLWFTWQGKPMLMGYNDNIPTNNAEDREMKNFFTFRPGQADYVNGPSNNTQWGWLEIYPQNKYAYNEEVAVGVAQNTCASNYYHASAFNIPGTLGRSYTGKNKSWDTRPDSYLYGANFQEQWDRGIQLDPYLIFVTGWNEYIAGKWDTGWQGDPFSFVDQFDWEHSRDIEPNNEWWDADGNYRGDTYYYQLIQNVRKFKGMTQREYASEAKTIKLDSMAAWTDVKPDFRHYKGNAIKRAHAGHADKYYNSSLGRNDIVDAKIARDAEYIYFYVETASAMTSPQDENWMMLFIDIDRNKSTGWEGYDYVVNYETPDASTGTVSKNVGGKCEWDKAGDFDYVVKGNKMAIRMKRSVLGIKDKIDLEFKWVDNMPKNTESGKPEYNASQFYTCGDAAPGARFNFIYTVK